MKNFNLNFDMSKYSAAICKIIVLRVKYKIYITVYQPVKSVYNFIRSIFKILRKQRKFISTVFANSVQLFISRVKD